MLRHHVGRTETLCKFAIRRRKRPSGTETAARLQVAYPSHPLSPELRSLISALPKGFSHIALQGNLSIQIIKLLHRLTTMTRAKSLTKRVDAISAGDTNSLQVEMMRHLGQFDISPLEKNICHFCYLFVEKLCGPSLRRNQEFYQRLRDNVREDTKNSLCSFLSLEGMDAGLSIWGVAILATVTDDIPGSDLSKLLKQLVQRYPMATEWDNKIRTLQEFLFPDKLVEIYRPWWAKEMGEYHSGR